MSEQYPIVKSPDIAPITQVDSTNLIDYLIVPRRSSVNPDSFAQTLDLTILSPFLQNVYNEREEVYVLSEADRQKVAQMEEQYKSTPQLQKTYSLMRGLTEIKSYGERASVIYYDPVQGGIAATPVRHGEFSSTNTDIAKVIEAKHFPVLEVHTHPNSSLFSPIDYARMIIDMTTNHTPLVRGITVLTPTVQILALSTAQTPFVSEDEFENKYRQFEQPTEEDQKRLDSLEKRWQTILGILTAHSNGMIAQFNTYFTEVEAQLMNNQITEAEANALLESKSKELIQADTSWHAKAERVSQRAAQQKLDFVNRLINRQLLQCSRDLHVKLYYSTDMANFIEFTA